MENPAQWGKATKIIDKVLDEYTRQEEIDLKDGNFRCGISLALRIAQRLRAEGYLKSEDVWMTGEE